MARHEYEYVKVCALRKRIALAAAAVVMTMGDKMIMHVDVEAKERR